MGDRGHNRHGPKRGGVLCPFRGAPGTSVGIVVIEVVVGTDIPMRRVASYTIVAKRLDG